MKISVVIPVYNTKKYLRDCVASVLLQEDIDTEIILVDDGSGDGAGELADLLASENRNVQVIHQENRGLSAARNAGLKRVTGDYVYFLDSDDRICRGTLARLTGLAEKYSADLVYSAYRPVYEKGQEEKTASDIGQLNDSGQLNDAELDFDSVTDSDCQVLEGGQIFEQLFSNNAYTVISCGKLIRASILEGMSFRDGRSHEDEFIIHHLLGACDRVVFTPQGLYLYLQRSGSITGRPVTGRAMRDVTEAYEDRLDYFKKRGMSREYAGSLKQLVGHIYAFLKGCGQAGDRKYLREELQKLYPLAKEAGIYRPLSLIKLFIKSRMG